MTLYLIIILAIVIITPRVIKRIHKFPVPVFVSHLLDSRMRRWIQPPATMIFRSGIKSGMKVLELGCGSGSCTLDIARVVGDKGKIYAVDIQPLMLEKLKHKLEKPENKKINNVETYMASVYELPFNNGFFDAVFLVDVLQEIPDAARALEEVHRVLKENGILAISEFVIDTDYPLPRTTRRQCEQAGYKLIRSSGNILSYTLRFVKSG